MRRGIATAAGANVTGKPAEMEPGKAADIFFTGNAKKPCALLFRRPVTSMLVVVGAEKKLLVADMDLTMITIEASTSWRTMLDQGADCLR